MTEENFNAHLEECQKRCDLRMTYIVESMREMRDALFGNGDKGMKVRVLETEYAVKDLQDTRSIVRKFFLGIISAFIIMAIGALASTWAAFALQRDSLDRLEQQVKSISASTK